jgi:hypothetical protein
MYVVRQTYLDMGPNYGPASIQANLIKQGYKISRYVRFFNCFVVMISDVCFCRDRVRDCLKRLDPEGFSKRQRTGNLALGQFRRKKGEKAQDKMNENASLEAAIEQSNISLIDEDENGTSVIHPIPIDTTGSISGVPVGSPSRTVNARSGTTTIDQNIDTELARSSDAELDRNIDKDLDKHIDRSR